MQRFTARDVDGSVFDLYGIDAPLPGLAVVQALSCDCTAELYGVLHVRSGASLFLTHSPEHLGTGVWEVLTEIDWTQPAITIASKRRALAVVDAAMELVPDAFQGDPMVDLDDVVGAGSDPD